MKKHLLWLYLPILLIACVPKKSLYSWNNYEKSSYTYLKNTDEESLQALIESYNQIIAKQTGTRGEIPPGIYADYGFILIQEGNTEDGKAMLIKEIELYPESKIFIERILKMIEE